MVGQAKLTLNELRTAIVEIELIINSRPLPYVTSSDLEEPLTPSHLLIGKQVLNLPDNLGYSVNSDNEDFTIYSSQLDRRSKHLANTLNHFWKRWRTEYLTELRESHRRSTHDCLTKTPIKEGDVVAVHDVSLHQGLWKLGWIQGVIAGQNGKIWGASKKHQHPLLRQLIQLLYPLEVHSQQKGLQLMQRLTSLRILNQKLNHRRKIFEPKHHQTPLIKKQDNTESVSLLNRLKSKERPVCLNLNNCIKLPMVDHVWSTGGGCGELNSVILIGMLLFWFLMYLQITLYCNRH